MDNRPVADKGWNCTYCWKWNPSTTKRCNHRYTNTRKKKCSERDSKQTQQFALAIRDADDEIERLQARVEKLEGVLNCDHVWTNEFGLKPFHCIWCGKPLAATEQGESDGT